MDSTPSIRESLSPEPKVPYSCIICGSQPVSDEINGIAIWKCTICALMWRQSFDVPISHYEDASGGFSKSKEFLQRRNIRDRIRTIGRDVSLDHTCDIGGSKGYFVEELLRSGYVGAYGIDPNKTQVEAASRSGIPMLVGSTADLHRIFPQRETKNASFFHVIEHLPDPTTVMTEIYEALPDGGYLIVETPDFSSYSFKKLNYVHKLVYEEHLFYFSAENLQRFLTNRGFTIQKVCKRDFDQYHLNAREALFRLGLMRREGFLPLWQKVLYKIATLLTTPLSLMVKFLKRNMYVLIIAKKPLVHSKTKFDRKG